MITFGQFKTGPAARSSGLDVDSDDFRQMTNDAVRMLLRRGQWWGTVQPISGCAYNGCVTWPRYVAAVLGILNRGKFSQPQNRWYQFLNWDSEMCGWASRYRGANGHPVTVFSGTSPVFSQIPCPNSVFINAYLSTLEDVGKTITIFGIDSDGQTAMSVQNGVLQEGVVLTLASTYVQTPIKFQKVTKVVKQPTSGVVRLYQWDGVTLNADTTPNQRDLAHYDPSEVCPEYNVSQATGCNSNIVTALVKLAYVPIVTDNDILIVDNEDAVAAMIQAIRYRDAGDEPRKRLFEIDAFRELNYQLKERFPDEQVPVAINLFGDGSRITSRI